MDHWDCQSTVNPSGQGATPCQGYPSIPWLNMHLCPRVRRARWKPYLSSRIDQKQIVGKHATPTPKKYVEEETMLSCHICDQEM